VKYELGFYIPEDGILHSDRRENSKAYDEALTNISGITSEQGGSVVLRPEQVFVRSPTEYASPSTHLKTESYAVSEMLCFQVI
jgi:hypothetical protein